jgi:CSLREA domain-containing protein
MNIFATYRRFVVSSSLALLCCAAIVLTIGRTSSAENQGFGNSTLQDVEDIVASNPAGIRFVTGARLRSDGDVASDGIDLAQVRPLTLASADVNEDGFPDLVCGYALAEGGLLVIHYGDAHAYAPTEQEDIQAALQDRYPVPFRGSAFIRLDHAPDFLFTGDFDRDSRRDIMTAARGGLSLNVLLSGTGGYAARSIELPGQLTTAAVSEAYTSDGFADVYAAIVGGRLLAFEKTDSIFAQVPDEYSLPGSADSIALGRFDNNSGADFAVLVAGQLYVVHGGKRSSTELVDLPFATQAVAVGDFIWDRDSRLELAVAAADGSTSIVSRGGLDLRPLSDEEARVRRQLIVDVRDGKRPESSLYSHAAYNAAWRIAEATSVRAGRSDSGSPTLIPMLASGQQSVDLLALNSEDGTLNISYRTDARTANRGPVSREAISLAAGAETVAALPMRLNLHARPSIVVLRKGSIEPEFLFVAPEAIFSVTKTADTADGTCNADCSLREAVIAANAAAGLDAIQFGVNGNFQLTRVGDDNTSLNGDLDINSDMTFVGNGVASTFIQGSNDATFASNMGDKAIGINQDGLVPTLNATIQNLTIRFTRNDITVNGGFTQTGGAMDIFLTGTGAPGPTTALTSVTFDSNASLHSYGGALNIDSGGVGTGVFRGTVNIGSCTFSNNDTLTTTVGPSDDAPSGGAINMFADMHNVTISNSTITGNQTSALITANGGGINMRHSFGGTITINTTTAITNNIAGSDGGGILTAFNQTLSISGGSITGNTAQGTGDSGTGGGLFNGNNTLSTTLTSVAITNNIATAGTAGTGGGVADGANVPITLNSCTITGNSADNGGGLAVISSGGTQTMTVSSSAAFSGNTATNGSAAYVSAGNLALSNTNTISGNIDLATNATAILTGSTGSTTNLTGNLTMGNGVINSNNSTFNITGSYSQSGGTFNGNTSTYGVSAGSTVSGGTFNMGTAYNVTGTFTQSGGTYNGGGTMTITGTGNFTKTNGAFGGGSGTINLIGNFSHTGGTFTASTSTFNFNGSGAQSITNNALITFNNISDANVTQPLTFNNSINVNGALTANGANTILNPVAAAVIGGTGTLTGTGTARVTRVSGTNDFLTQYTITNKTLTNLLIDYVGAAAQGISGVTYSNVRLNNAAGGTLNAPATVTGTLSLTAGAFNVGTSSLTLDNGVTVGAGSLTSSATGTVIYNQLSNGQQVIAAQYGNLTFSNFNKILPAAGTVFISGTFTPGTAVGHTITGSTVVFNGAAAQNLPSGFTTYNNLTLNNPTTVTGFAGLTVQGLLRVQAGTFTSSSTYNNVQVDTGATLAGVAATTINASGNWTNNGTFTANSNTVNFNGTGLQTVGGSSPTTFNNLTMNNAAGVSLALGATVNGALTLTSGEIATGANTLTMGTASTVNRTSGHVVGTLQKNFAGPGPLFTMPVGTAGAYSPLNVTVTAGAGQLTARPNTGVPAVLAVNSARTLQRYWTLSGSGITSNITFNYLDGDVPGPPNNENIWEIIRVTGAIAIRYSPTLPYITMNPAGNQFTINSLSSYSDWTAGEPLAPTAANVSVSGRVRDLDGRGIGNAQVMIQNQQGEIMWAITNPFGYYQITDVPAGQTYLVSVTHKRYTFEPRTLNLSDDVVGMDFIPLSPLASEGNRVVVDSP